MPIETDISQSHIPYLTAKLPPTTMPLSLSCARSSKLCHLSVTHCIPKEKPGVDALHQVPVEQKNAGSESLSERFSGPQAPRALRSRRPLRLSGLLGPGGISGASLALRASRAPRAVQAPRASQASRALWPKQPSINSWSFSSKGVFLPRGFSGFQGLAA